MRLFLIFTTVFLLAMPRVFAQESGVSSAASALQDVLDSLKQSADQLGAANNQLITRDQQIQNQITQLQSQLGHLQAQGEVLNNQASLLQQDNPARGDQVSRLVAENQQLDRQIQQAQQGIESIEEALGQPHLTVMPAPPTNAETAFEQQKEKVLLIKAIDESQQRQEALHLQIQNFQKSMPKVSMADALAHQQFIEKQIKDLEEEEANYSSNNSDTSDQWANTQLGQLQTELGVLEKNYAQLKELMSQMDQKTKNGKMSIEDRAEGSKLQNNLEDLTRQNESLKIDLDGLRSQLVDLDKRKTNLEEMVKHLPAY